MLALFLIGPASVLASSAHNGNGLQIFVPPSVNGRPGSDARSRFVCPTISGADTSVCSTNWSGYAVTGASGSVTAVSGSWTVPSVVCSSGGTTYAAIWVGIDGYSSSTVEQTGIFAECSGGSASYAAWYEFYPNPSVSISSSSVPVAPGDTITAGVTYSAATGQFTTSISSTGGGTTFSTSAAVSGAQRSSAEWVVERPELCSSFYCTLATLSNFGVANLAASSATVNGVIGSISTGTFTNAAITMVAGSFGPVLAEPTSLTNSGASFAVDYE